MLAVSGAIVGALFPMLRAIMLLRESMFLSAVSILTHSPFMISFHGM